MKKFYSVAIFALMGVLGIVIGGSVKAETFSVTSCEQVGNDIRISRNNGPKYMLTSSCRDAGHGMRQYTLRCVSGTQYSVQWSTPSSCTDRDVVHPQVSVSGSKTWAQHGDTVSVTATANDNKAVTKIDIHEDSTIVKTCTGTSISSCVYTFVASAQQSTEKTRVFKAKAYDAAGNAGNSSAVVVHIVPIQDVTKPVVILEVSNASIKTGQQVTITSTASDANGIAKIDIYRNGERVHTCTNTTSCVYTTTLILPSWANSLTYTFRARATDTRGNWKNSNTPEVLVTR